MSLSLADADAPARAAPRRIWRLPRRGPPVTVFLQHERAWRYAAAGAEAVRVGTGTGTDWLEALAGQTVRVVLSGALTRQCVVSDPTLPLDDLDAVAEWARHQFVHYHGPVAQAWPIAAWLDGRQRGASATHGVDLDALTRQAARHQVRLLGMHPWWSVALPIAAGRSAGVAHADHVELWVVEAALALRLRCADGGLEAIETHWLEQPTTAALATLLNHTQRDTERDAERDTEQSGSVPLVLGYGLAGDTLAPTSARSLGPLAGECPDARWIGA